MSRQSGQERGKLIVLLEKRKVRNENREDPCRILKQVISPPEPLTDVPALDMGVRKKLTPMLRDRFEFAGEWVNAVAAQTWLSLSRMAAILKKRSVRQQIARRTKYWSSSIVAKTPKDSLSLFAIDEVEQEESYLVWGKRKEPGIVAYTCNDEKFFASLKAYLIYLTK